MSNQNAIILTSHLKNINVYQSYVNTTTPTSLSITAVATVCGLKKYKNLIIPFNNLINVINTNTGIAGTF